MTGVLSIVFAIFILKGSTPSYANTCDGNRLCLEIETGLQGKCSTLLHTSPLCKAAEISLKESTEACDGLPTREGRTLCLSILTPDNFSHCEKLRENADPLYQDSALLCNIFSNAAFDEDFSSGQCDFEDSETETRLLNLCSAYLKYLEKQENQKKLRSSLSTSTGTCPLPQNIQIVSSYSQTQQNVIQVSRALAHWPNLDLPGAELSREELIEKLWQIFANRQLALGSDSSSSTLLLRAEEKKMVMDKMKREWLENQRVKSFKDLQLDLQEKENKSKGKNERTPLLKR